MTAVPIKAGSTFKLSVAMTLPDGSAFPGHGRVVSVRTVEALGGAEIALNPTVAWESERGGKMLAIVTRANLDAWVLANNPENGQTIGKIEIDHDVAGTPAALSNGQYDSANDVTTFDSPGSTLAFDALITINGSTPRRNIDNRPGFVSVYGDLSAETAAPVIIPTEQRAGTYDLVLELNA